MVPLVYNRWWRSRRQRRSSAGLEMACRPMGRGPQSSAGFEAIIREADLLRQRGLYHGTS